MERFLSTFHADVADDTRSDFACYLQTCDGGTSSGESRWKSSQRASRMCCSHGEFTPTRLMMVSLDFSLSGPKAVCSVIKSVYGQS